MFKVKHESKLQNDYFKEHRSIALYLTEAEYQAVFQAAGDVASMGEVFRQMLAHKVEEGIQPTRATSFWTTALFYSKVKSAAKEHGVSVKTFIASAIRDCIYDLRTGRHAQGRGSKVDKRSS